MTVDVFVRNKYKIVTEVHEMEMSRFLNNKTNVLTLKSPDNLNLLHQWSCEKGDRSDVYFSFLQIAVDYSDGKKLNLIIDRDGTVCVGVFKGEIYDSNSTKGWELRRFMYTKSSQVDVSKEEVRFQYFIENLDVNDDSFINDLFGYGAYPIRESYDDYNLVNYPRIDFTTIDSELNIEFMPREILEDWSGNEGVDIGFSYHCNESNYSTHSIDYRYGFARKVALKDSIATLQISDLNEYKLKAVTYTV